MQTFVYPLMKAIAAVLLCCALPCAAELPVKEVILYKHGVGFFARSGNLAPGESARIDFRASEMNDVLKSLTVEEKGGGKITGLRYDSSIPLEQKLADFSFTIAEGQPLSAVLDQLKGARIELQLGTGKAVGTIVSARVAPGDRERPEREQVSLLVDSGDLRTVELAAASSLRFTDPKLQQQFKDYLAAVAHARSKDRRSVYIDSTDSKGREVLASYMIPSPLWKSSYRLIFGENGQPTLEGWAIVDNTTDDDWTNVRMSLVSGKPISFVSALYEPKYVHRMSADLPEERAVAPTVYSGAVDQQATARKGAGMAGGGSGGVAGGVLGGIVAGLPSAAPPPPPPNPFFRRVEASSVADPAAGRDLGELFEYRMPNAVTVKKNESAMLPFLQQKITGRKLLIYSDQSRTNPFNAAELTNSTGKTLDGGPITVFDGGAYAGEALVETVKNGDKRLINYAVDLGTRVTSNLDSKGDLVREVHVNRGTLITRFSANETKTYTARNVDPKAKTLIVEHPVRPQYNLLSQKPAETTATAYRFELTLPPGASSKLAVNEERVFTTTYGVSSLTQDLLATYVQNKDLSPAARQQLQRILDAKRRIASLEAQTREIDARIHGYSQDQERMRQNIQSLNQVSGQQQQVQTYASSLSSLEKQITAARDQQAETQKQLTQAGAALNALIEQMDF